MHGSGGGGTVAGLPALTSGPQGRTVTFVARVGSPTITTGDRNA